MDRTANGSAHTPTTAGVRAKLAEMKKRNNAKKTKLDDKDDMEGLSTTTTTSTSTSPTEVVLTANRSNKAICLRNLKSKRGGMTNALLSRIYKDIIDIPHFPTVRIKCIFETREEKRERRRIERAKHNLSHPLEQLPVDESSDESSSEDDEDLDLDIKALKVIITPLGGPWKHASVPFRFDIPKTYPNDPPKLTCLKRIYHPSIDLNGRVCLGLINEWMSILNFESIIIELEQLLAQPSPSKPLVKDVGNELLDHPDAFAENVERSKRGGVIRGVYYDRLDGIAPDGVGYNSLKNICFTQIFEWIKQSKKAKLRKMVQQQQRLYSDIDIDDDDEEHKEGWEECVMSEDDDVYSESDPEESSATTPRGPCSARRGGGGAGEKGKAKAVKSREEYKRFDESMVESLPWELREIIEEYSRIIERNQLQKLARKEKKAKDEQIRLGGKVYIRNLAGKMTMIEGVEPTMTIWQMKELLDAKTGMVPYTLQLFYHQVLDDRKTVAEYNIREGSVVYIVLAWGGG